VGLFTPVDEATRVLDLHMCGREVDSGAGTRTGVVMYRYVQYRYLKKRRRGVRQRRAGRPRLEVHTPSVGVRSPGTLAAEP
jgi:hypothetical protein